MKLSDNLIKLRKDQGLSKEELAQKLGVSEDIVSKWELGVETPDEEKMSQIAQIFNVTVADLTAEKVEKAAKSAKTATSDSNNRPTNGEKSGMNVVLKIFLILFILGFIAMVVFVGINGFRIYQEAMNIKNRDVHNEVESHSNNTSNIVVNNTIENNTVDANAIKNEVQNAVNAVENKVNDVRNTQEYKDAVKDAKEIQDAVKNQDTETLKKKQNEVYEKYVPADTKKQMDQMRAQYGLN